MSTPRPRLELAIVLCSAITFFLLLASYMAFRPVRDALILDGNPDDIPWLFTGTLVATLIVSPLWSALLVRRARRRVVPIAFWAFALCLVGFAVLVGIEVSPVWVGRAFYIWSSVFNIFVVSVFWSLLADLLGPATARRLYGPIAAGGTLGALAGPALTKAIVNAVGVHGVLLMSACMLGVAAMVVRVVRRLGEQLGDRDQEPATAAKPTSVRSAWEPLDRVARQPYLAAIVGYVLCTAWAATFLYLEQASIVKTAFATREARAEWFSTVDFASQGVALILQSFIAAPLLGRLGPGLVLCALPLIQGLGISALAVTPTVTTLAIVQLASRGVTHGLTRPARELLFTVVERDDKYRAKNAIDTIAYRFGDFSGSWLHRGLAALTVGNTPLVVATIPLVGLWIGLALGLGAGFGRRAADRRDDQP
ncbi:MAG: NTP/NDP exchange transporter [Kofleriaceae bacterium]